MIDDYAFLFPIAPILFVLTLVIVQSLRRQRRLAFIAAYKLPAGLHSRVCAHHPGIAARDLHKLEPALKQFFLAHLRSGRKPVTMPSKAAGALWLEFTRTGDAYDGFCRKAFGRTLDYAPPAVLDPARPSDNAGLRRVWWQACKIEGLNPMTAERLPLLFALDGDLGISDGYRYKPLVPPAETGGGDATIGITYETSDFGSLSIDGTLDGFGEGGDGGGDGGDGGGDGGGGGD